MKISETHKNFPCGAKGRLVIRNDADEVIDTIFTPVQAARRYCERNPDSPEGVRFAAALAVATGVSGEAPVLSVPIPVELTGKNPANTALMSAQRKLSALYAAALSVDPVHALNGIKTSRGNKYLNTCDDYKQQLLAYFAERGEVG